MSRTSRVPFALPAVRHRSSPCSASRAAKKTAGPTAVDRIVERFFSEPACDSQSDSQGVSSPRTRRKHVGRTWSLHLVAQGWGADPVLESEPSEPTLPCSPGHADAIMHR